VRFVPIAGISAVAACGRRGLWTFVPLRWVGATYVVTMLVLEAAVGPMPPVDSSRDRPHSAAGQTSGEPEARSHDERRSLSRRRLIGFVVGGAGGHRPK
jgi:hypothetical protein